MLGCQQLWSYWTRGRSHMEPTQLCEPMACMTARWHPMHLCPGLSFTHISPTACNSLAGCGVCGGNANTDGFGTKSKAVCMQLHMFLCSPTPTAERTCHVVLHVHEGMKWTFTRDAHGWEARSRPLWIRTATTSRCAQTIITHNTFLSIISAHFVNIS